MKKAICTAMMLCTLSLCIVGCNGCKADKINVIHTDNVVTNTVPTKAFNDESYVWENWSFGTNKVDKID